MRNETITLTIPDLDSPLWREADLWRLWSWSLFHVSKKCKNIRVEGLRLKLAAGELAVPLATIGEETGLNMNAVQRALLIGKDLGIWTVQFTPWWVRLHIVN